MAGGNLIKYTGDVITPTKYITIKKKPLDKHHIQINDNIHVYECEVLPS